MVLSLSTADVISIISMVLICSPFTALLIIQISLCSASSNFAIISYEIEQLHLANRKSLIRFCMQTNNTSLLAERKSSARDTIFTIYVYYIL